MTGYRVIVHGVFAPAPTPDGPRPRGFYTARSVHAASREDAAIRVLALIQDDPRVDAIAREWATQRPDIAVEEIVELGLGDPIDDEPQGFIFYNESDLDVNSSQ